MTEGTHGAMLSSEEPPQKEAVRGVCLLSLGFSARSCSVPKDSDTCRPGWLVPEVPPAVGGSSFSLKVKW